MVVFVQVVAEVGEGTTFGHPPPGGVLAVVARVFGRTDSVGMKLVVE
jgi:hypothetical protein